MKKLLLLLLCIPIITLSQQQIGQTIFDDNAQQEAEAIATNKDGSIIVIGYVGEVIFSETLKDFSGDYNRTVDMTAYPNAIYILQLNTKEGILNKKLILEK